MARIFTSGAEFGNQAQEGLTSLTGTTPPTFDTGVKRSGSYSYKCDAGAGGTFSQVNWDSALVLGRNYYARGYCYIPSGTGYPTTNARIMMLYRTGGGSIAVGVYLTTTGTLQASNQSGNVGSPSDVLALDTWYRIETRTKIASGSGDDETELLLNGVQVAVVTGATLDTVATNRFAFGWLDSPGANKVIYWDDMALNDDQGATSQVTFPGDSNIVLLKPVSDNAIGGWTAGAGGTTNLWQAVDNVPPAGLAAETDTSQIESLTNSASDPCDFNMTSYTSAGLAAGGTVVLARLRVIHAEDVATGTKTGSCIIVSNPAQGAATTFTFGNDLGALGDYSTNWITHDSTTLFDQSVTAGTSPVARVTKTTASTRVGSVCQLVILVDYAPPGGVSYAPPTATATGAGVVPQVLTAAPAPQAAATGAGSTFLLSLSVAKATATGAGIAPTAVITATSPIAAATGAGIAPTVVSSVSFAPSLATATGAGVVPSVVVAVSAPAATTAGTGAAPAVALSSPTATGTGTGAAAGFWLLAPIAQAIGSGFNPTVQVPFASPKATATGSALAPSSLALVAPKASATGSGIVPAVVSTFAVPAALASGAASAPTLATAYTAPQTTSTGAAATPAVALLATAAAASGSATAPAGTISVLAPAATASGAGLAPTAVSTFTAPKATATGSALAPSSIALAAPRATAAGVGYEFTIPGLDITAYQPPLASATGAAATPGVVATWNADSGSAAGVSFSPSMQAVANAPAGQAAGSAIAPASQATATPDSATTSGAALAPIIALTAPQATSSASTATPAVVVGVSSNTAISSAQAYAPDITGLDVTAFEPPLALASGAADAPAVLASFVAPEAVATGQGKEPTLDNAFSVPSASIAGNGLSPMVATTIPLAVVVGDGIVPSTVVVLDVPVVIVAGEATVPLLAASWEVDKAVGFANGIAAGAPLVIVRPMTGHVFGDAYGVILGTGEAHPVNLLIGIAPTVPLSGTGAPSRMVGIAPPKVN